MTESRCSCWCRPLGCSAEAKAAPMDPRKTSQRKPTRLCYIAAYLKIIRQTMADAVETTSSTSKYSRTNRRHYRTSLQLKCRKSQIRLCQTYRRSRSNRKRGTRRRIRILPTESMSSPSCNLKTINRQRIPATALAKVIRIIINIQQAKIRSTPAEPQQFHKHRRGSNQQ